MTNEPDQLDGRHGAHTRRALQARWGERAVRAAVDKGELIGFGRGVLLEADRQLDVRTRGAGALLLAGPGGVLVGPTAARLHGWNAVGGPVVHVLVPYDQRIRSRHGMVVRQGRVPAADVTEVAGLRVLGPAATVCDVLCESSGRGGLACADEVLRTFPERARPAFVAAVRHRLAARLDRRNTRRAGELLDLATGLPASPLASALLLAMVDVGIPRPVLHRQEGLDFAWPSHQLGLSLSGATRPGWEVIQFDPATAGPAAIAALCALVRDRLRGEPTRTPAGHARASQIGTGQIGASQVA